MLCCSCSVCSSGSMFNLAWALCHMGASDLRPASRVVEMFTAMLGSVRRHVAASFVKHGQHVNGLQGGAALCTMWRCLSVLH